MTCNMKYWNNLSFLLVLWQFTDHLKLPLEVVGSPRACKLYNSSLGCPKPLYLNDLNGNINITDGAREPEENSGS